MKKLVSIIIPTYKTNDSLKKAIDSVLSQTYKNIEIIVVDDNKPESEFRKKTERIMKCYKDFSNIKYVKHKQNRNGSAARNTGVNNAKGEYIAFLDDDDFFYKNKLEKQINIIEEKGSDGCTCFYKKNGKTYKFEDKENYTYEILMNKITPQTSSLVIKRTCYEDINGFDESYFRHQDYEFLLRFFEKYKLSVVKEVLYEMCDNGVNNIPDGKKMEIIKDKFLTDFEYIIDKYSLNKKKVYGKNYSTVCFAYLKQKKIKKCIYEIIKHFNCYLVYYLMRRCIKGIRSKIR